MTINIYLPLGIFLFAIIFFVSEWLCVDGVVLAVVVALMITQLLTPAEAIGDLFSPIVLTIASLFITAEGNLAKGDRRAADASRNDRDNGRAALAIFLLML